MNPLRSIRYRVARRVRLVEDWYVGVRDRRRVRRAFPRLAGYGEVAQRSRQQVEPYYREYVATVSPEGMAISLELAAFVDVVCTDRSPRRLLDLGSGFSSVVLRRYAREAAFSVDVHSVDHDPQWLEATRRYLDSHGLDASGLTTWSDFRSRAHTPFDLILHDLGNSNDVIQFRLSVLPEVLDLVAPDGMLILDDAHWPPLSRGVRRLLAARGFRYWSLKKFVEDRFGRFALIAAR